MQTALGMAVKIGVGRNALCVGDLSYVYGAAQ